MNVTTLKTGTAAVPAKKIHARNTRRVVPVSLLVYGPEGIGKSTLAASAPASVFLAAEDGLSEIEAQAFDEPTSLGDVWGVLTHLLNAAHDFRTLAIDTLDWLEPLVWAQVCADSGKRDIEAFGYGKGYTAALDVWRTLLRRLDELRSARGMSVILLAHSRVRTFKNPAGDDYDRYALKIHDGAAGLVKEWVQAVLFAQHETLTREANGRSKGISTGARVLHTRREAAFDAKNRFGLPERLPLDWEELYAAIRAHRPEEPDAVRARMRGMLAELGDEALTVTVEAFIARTGDDAVRLAHGANKLVVHYEKKRETAT